jgi:hypothetical protein
MNLAGSFSDVNWLSVIVAALLAFAVGGLWYSPVLFSKAWMNELKLNEADMKNANMPLIFGLTFVLNVAGAIVLDMFIGTESTWLSGLLSGLLVSIAWIATSFGINYLFARKSLRLFLIDSFYFITFFAVEGIVLGMW